MTGLDEIHNHQTTLRKIVGAINTTITYAGVKPRYIATTAKIRRDLLRAEGGHVDGDLLILGIPVLVDNDLPPGAIHVSTDEPPSATGNHD